MNENKFSVMEKIEDSVALALDGGNASRDLIIEMVKMNAEFQQRMLQIEGLVSPEDILEITKRIEARFDISMGAANILYADDYTPWLDDAREEIDWYYWDHYKRLLPDKKFSKKVISVLDIDTNKILDHLENPRKEGVWKRKGLCVGHVQSGKTANYLGVICKAADAGYKVIIVLAGLLNPLRNQTQERIDEGFIGLDSSRQLDNADMKEKLIGVGKLRTEWRTPVSLTTSTQDFDKKIATQLKAQIQHFNEPVIFVIKKNVTILRNLIDWLRHNNPELNQYPMLLIDDEADHASVNTNKDDVDPTATNSRIRELLSLFGQSSYLGYTATPFANIFIDPDTDDDMLKDDLFPRDFIISLDTPTNYIGARRIFEDDGDLDIVREIDDYEDILPLKHKKDEVPDRLPPSLYEAVRTFIIVKVIKILRGQENSHNSMLVNVSRFTNIQTHIKLHTHYYLEELRAAVKNHYALPEHEAMSNRDMADMRRTWEKEFSDIEFGWPDIQKELSRAISPIRVIEVNSSCGSEPLDYNRRDYPNGRNVIAVGGLSLSRGLTLEGLTVSYFLRNSIMYDTLMQMGRWFGYRPGFEDICRIYMTEEARSWYAHISEVTEELREEFKRMERAGMTPSDFGLCVRSHPETLIVTARNKMRTAREVPRQVSFEGRLIETSVLLKTKRVVADNLQCFKGFVQDLSGHPVTRDSQPGYLYKDIPLSKIIPFLESYQNHPASQLTERKPVLEYAEWLRNRGIDEWDVIMLSLSNKSGAPATHFFSELPIIPQKRTVSDFPGNGIELNRRRLASRGHEKAGLTKHEIAEAESSFRLEKPDEKEVKNYPDRIYRAKRKKPLLMLHVLDCRKKSEPDIPLFPDGIIAFGISFPGEAGTRRPEKLVGYMVNVVWWAKNYGTLLDEEEPFD
ncbi:Z1 domain-containing protein [Thermodesulfobacteriota bacterium B35]